MVRQLGACDNAMGESWPHCLAHTTRPDILKMWPCTSAHPWRVAGCDDTKDAFELTRVSSMKMIKGQSTLTVVPVKYQSCSMSFPSFGPESFGSPSSTFCNPARRPVFRHSCTIDLLYPSSEAPTVLKKEKEEGSATVRREQKIMWVVIIIICIRSSMSRVLEALALHRLTRAHRSRAAVYRARYWNAPEKAPAQRSCSWGNNTWPHPRKS